MKLSKRLTAIADHVNLAYPHIWDCCCDHGYLGRVILDKVLEQEKPAKVHFVDCVANITAPLLSQLQQQGIDSRYWQVHCIDVADLPLQPLINQRHCVVLAGVGGELTLQLVTALLEQFPDHDIEFVLCPVHHQYALRQGLIALDLKLVAEQLIDENGRFYEILVVNKQGQHRLYEVGSLMWQHTESRHLAYLQAKIKHYQRLGLGGQSSTGIITAYQNLLANLDSPLK
ncbi:tRNA (adenine(22)-N(1))-methyltransferase TrmK [Motilimonas sp. 1_MG-2023]|uniref:tRNA (adenine(22)-N(1))-methyltransferase n=1 Tax=Motilimonas sp. 1_MG-2023 TaxID=3062672 RepID=UPI0026E3FD72|nr:tRNA (adenine(22)-N(1))-methyltransferase TrmK [Motilimonas sp. 1_MG-2023]MDO6526347.1 tRNA (adenine(22)-N(1))-methyltransferase TrmK [Motilimonas sp. 1_MG-2023]